MGEELDGGFAESRPLGGHNDGTRSGIDCRDGEAHRKPRRVGRDGQDFCRRREKAVLIDARLSPASAFDALHC